MGVSHQTGDSRMKGYLHSLSALFPPLKYSENFLAFNLVLGYCATNYVPNKFMVDAAAKMSHVRHQNRLGASKNAGACHTSWPKCGRFVAFCGRSAAMCGRSAAKVRHSAAIIVQINVYGAHRKDVFVPENADLMPSKPVQCHTPGGWMRGILRPRPRFSCEYRGRVGRGRVSMAHVRARNDRSATLQPSWKVHELEVMMDRSIDPLATGSIHPRRHCGFFESIRCGVIELSQAVAAIFGVGLCP
jgi:hypothetical protein